MLHGSLSLPARLCLLSWDTATGEPLAADRLPYLVRAGALTELARRGPLTDVDGIVTPADLDARTGTTRSTTSSNWSWSPGRAPGPSG